MRKDSKGINKAKGTSDNMTRKSKQLLSRVSGIILLAALSLLMNHYYGFVSVINLTEGTNPPSGTMEVHFIDVGQGDSILVKTDSEAMLIDAGDNDSGTLVTDYLKDQGITELNYIIGTHPHADHIGGLDTVLNSISVDTVIFPSVSHTTDTFEDVLEALEKKHLSITKAAVGSRYSLGSAVFTIVAPNSPTYDEINNYSVGIKLTFGDTSFLMTGDAQRLSEDEMLANGIDLSADVLKLGHHGSADSTGAEFLEAVNPSYAVISVGKYNVYRHPNTQTIQELLKQNIEVYRTDEQGTIVFTSDGDKISVRAKDYNN